MRITQLQNNAPVWAHRETLLLLSSFSLDNLKYRIYFNWKALFIGIEMYEGVIVRVNGFTFETS